jgi:GDPmannose 4,6-dehydratase
MLKLGNLDARRDWGFAGDYVAGIWAIIQATGPDDYVLATGNTWSVRDFVSKAATCLGFDLEWDGAGEKEIGINRKTGKIVVSVDPLYYRPAEVDHLVGNSAKASRQLGWQASTSFDELVEMMIRADYNRVASCFSENMHP